MGNWTYQDYKYILYEEGGTVYVKNGVTGDIDFPPTADYCAALRLALDSFSGGRGGKIYTKDGSYSGVLKDVSFDGNVSSFVKAGVVLDVPDVRLDFSDGAHFSSDLFEDDTCLFAVDALNVSIRGGVIDDAWCGIILSESADLFSLKGMRIQGGAGKHLKYCVYGGVALGNMTTIKRNFFADTVDEGVLLYINGANHTDSYVIKDNTFGQNDGESYKTKGIYINGSTDGTPLSHIKIGDNHFKGNYAHWKSLAYSLAAMDSEHVAIQIHGSVRPIISDNHFEDFATAELVTDSSNSVADTLILKENIVYVGGYDLLVDVTEGEADSDVTSSYRELEVSTKKPEIIYSNIPVGVPDGKLVLNTNEKGILLYYGVPTWRDSFLYSECNMEVVLPVLFRTSDTGNQLSAQWMTHQQRQKFDDMTLPYAEPASPDKNQIYSDGNGFCYIYEDVEAVWRKVRLGYLGVCINQQSDHPSSAVVGEAFIDASGNLHIKVGTSWKVFNPDSTE